MNKFWILLALVLLASGIVLAPHIWNSTENGPDIVDPSVFLGCYGSRTDKITVEQNLITVARTHQSIRIVRFFYLKTEAAVETIRNLEIDVNSNNLHVGQASTGFFYKFDDQYRPSALLVPDDGGTLRRLNRINC